MTDRNPADFAYRPSVGMMLFNRAGRVFVARRIDTPGDAWQMPQGGIDAGETPAEAALRELAEETGTAKAEIIAESGNWLTYDLPEDLAKTLWGGRYRGQRQKWFALRFTGTDSDIDLETAEPEFNAWKWVALDEVPRLIVGFKRPLYEEISAEFRPIAERIEAGG
jgi:putative (di)nucleoside polyphosphate hydrolase